MAKLYNALNAFISFYVILLQVYGGCGQALRQSVVRISNNGLHVCAGTLVRPNFVVTAAHCVQNLLPATLKVFGVDAASTADVSNIFIAPNYRASLRNMNVAVLKLAANISGVTPATLCNQNWRHGTSITVYPWTTAQPDRVTVLNNFPMNVYGRFQCRAHYPINTDHMFCGYSPNNIVCFRDRGGPVEVNGQFCGIISYGRRCTNANSPLVFINVGRADVSTFINNQLLL